MKTQILKIWKVKCQDLNWPFSRAEHLSSTECSFLHFPLKQLALVTVRNWTRWPVGLIQSGSSCVFINALKSFPFYKGFFSVADHFFSFSPLELTVSHVVLRQGVKVVWKFELKWFSHFQEQRKQMYYTFARRNKNAGSIFFLNSSSPNGRW